MSSDLDEWEIAEKIERHCEEFILCLGRLVSEGFKIDWNTTLETGAVWMNYKERFKSNQSFICYPHGLICRVNDNECRFNWTDKVDLDKFIKAAKARTNE